MNHAGENKESVEDQGTPRASIKRLEVTYGNRQEALSRRRYLAAH